MILNSPYISGSLTVTGNTNLIGALTVTGSLAGTATSSSFAYTASSAVSAYTAASAVNATTALTASYATSFTVGGTLTAQTLVVQTITSSVSFITGSTRFGSLLTNTHQFTGSLQITGSGPHYVFGNVGIGTSSPGYTLDVRTDTGVLIRGATSNSDAILSFLPTTGGRQYDFRNFGSSFAILDSSANITRMYFNFSGNTGIGLTNPSALLHVSGSGSGSLMQISSHVSSNIFFVSGSGNIGIGTTTPTEKFDVIGGAVAAGNGTIRTGITYSTLGLIGTFTNHDLGVITNGTTKMTILSGGSVGIGTTSPVQKLHVEGSAAIGTTGTEDILILGRALSGGVSFQQAASLKLGRYQNAGGAYESYTRLDFALRDNSAASNYNTNTTVMTLTNQGYVGIGTTSPSNKVDIFGAGSSSSGTLAVRGSGSGTFIVNRLVSRETSNGTATIATVSSPGGNDRVFFKIQVINVSAVSNYGNAHVGYALWDATTKSVTTMTLDTGNSNISNTNVGSLSWSGNNLQYTTNGAGNYENNHIIIYAVARDSATVI